MNIHYKATALLATERRDHHIFNLFIYKYLKTKNPFSIGQSAAPVLYPQAVVQCREFAQYHLVIFYLNTADRATEQVDQSNRHTIFDKPQQASIPKLS